MPAVVNVMNEGASLVTLIKPQFEARRSQARFFFLLFSFFQRKCFLHE